MLTVVTTAFLPVSAMTQEKGAGTGSEASADAAFGYSMARAIGADVRDQQDESVGEIHDVIIGADGRVEQVVVSTGGLLGVADTLVAIPFGSLTFARGQAMLTSDKLLPLEERQALTYPDDDQVFVVLMPTNAAASGSARQMGETMREYLRQAGRKVQDWQGRVDAYADQARKNATETADEAAQTVQQSWSEVQRQWRRLQKASGEAWVEATKGFEKAFDEFSRTWNEATNKQKRQAG